MSAHAWNRRREAKREARSLSMFVRPAEARRQARMLVETRRELRTLMRALYQIEKASQRSARALDAVREAQVSFFEFEHFGPGYHVCYTTEPVELPVDPDWNGAP